MTSLACTGNASVLPSTMALRACGGRDMVRAMLTAAELQILSTSLGVAGRAVLFSLPVAIAFAWALSRRNFPGKSVLDTIAHLPLVLPPVLVGYMLLLGLGATKPARGMAEIVQFGIQLVFTAEGAAIATAVMAFPLMVRAIRLSFEATDPGIFQAASVLRAGPWDRFWSMTLPLAWPGVLAGAVTAFAAGLRRVDAMITFASNVEGETQTLPLAINAALDAPGRDDLAFRLAMISLVAAITGLVLAEMLQRWARRRLDAVTLVLREAVVRRGGFRLAADFEIASEGVTVVFGPSGSGKSTLLATIAGLNRLETGSVTFNGRVLEDAFRKTRVPTHARGIGLVFQDARLFPHLTVRGNIAYAEGRRPAARNAPLTDEIARRLEFEALLDRPVRNLSGGEKGRVALARAIVSAPELLLLDEPFAALDGKRRRDYLVLLRELSREQGVPMMVVTHQIDDAADLAAQVITMQDGRVIAHGAAGDVMARPDFLGLLDRRDIGVRLPASALAGRNAEGVWGAGG